MVSPARARDSGGNLRQRIQHRRRTRCSFNSVDHDAIRLAIRVYYLGSAWFRVARCLASGLSEASTYRRNKEAVVRPRTDGYSGATIATAKDVGRRNWSFID